MRLACGFEILCSKQPELNTITTESNSVSQRFELFCLQLTAQKFFASVTNEAERLSKREVARGFFNRQESRNQSNATTTTSNDAPLSAPSFPSCLDDIDIPEDDMDWLRNSSELNAKMAKYSTTESSNEDGATGPQKDMQSAHEMASRLAEEMKEFVNATSDYSGVDSTTPPPSSITPPPPTAPKENKQDHSFSLDIDKLLSILGSDIGAHKDSSLDLDSDEESTADSTPLAPNEEEIEENEAIAEAMHEELLESTLASTFTAAEDVSSSKDRPRTVPKSSGGELAPLDLDVNLISNMLESYSAQQGLPGPVSNICGELGLALPDDKKM